MAERCIVMEISVIREERKKIVPAIQEIIMQPRLLKGRWYIFGHRMTNYTAFSRQGVAEAVRILPDGSIPQIEMTSCGIK